MIFTDEVKMIDCPLGFLVALGYRLIRDCWSTVNHNFWPGREKFFTVVAETCDRLLGREGYSLFSLVTC
jgi:hypothetical protein